jgi:alkanesulfonate monooxygenase SsuD/methylene tetrahydromethanopterin reductase-like flavin-dependent oxidoreductase (luciferase family)
MTAPPRLVLGVALGGAGDGSPVTLDGWLGLVGEAEAAGLDLVVLGDRFGAVPGPAGPPQLNPSLVAAALAPRTGTIALVPVVSTTDTEPIRVATQVATLDHVSRGRAGWVADVAGDRGRARYVTWAPVAPAERTDEAAEHVEVVRQLCDSWEDGAEIRDTARHRFVDREKLHRIDHVGRFFSVQGPSITPRPPQGVVPVLSRVAQVAPDVLLADARGDAPVTLAERDAALPNAAAVAALADELLALGVDGAILRPVQLPRDLEAIARALVPRLQAAGARPAGPPAGTLRDRLGLARPANRYATA